MTHSASCKICGAHALTPVFDLSDHANPSNSLPLSLFHGKPNLVANGTHPIFSRLSEFVLCDPSIDAKACGLLQRPANAPLSERRLAPSARSRTTRNHLRDAATEALEMISGRDCSALDIGCNDGTLLSYYPRWVERFGVDPDISVDEIGEWAWSAREAFPSNELDQAFGSKQFDIITCISTFEEVTDPNPFLANVRNRLVDDGLFVLETMYAPIALTSNSFEYSDLSVKAVYSLHVLEYLVRKNDMKIVRGGMTSKDGGSVRLFITHKTNDNFDFEPWNERLARLWDEETVLALRDRAPYQTYLSRLYSAQQDFEDMLADIASFNEEVAVLGTDDHAADLLSWAGKGIDAIKFMVSDIDRDAKDDIRIADLPILSQTDCRARQPAYLLAPASRKQEAMEQWRESILSGCRLIIATPEPHIVDAVNYSAEYGKAISQGDSSAGVETLRAILFAAGGPKLISDNDLDRAESA